MWGKIIDFEADCKDAQEVENEMLIVSILLFLKKNKKKKLINERSKKMKKITITNIKLTEKE